MYSKLCEFASKYLLDILEDSKNFSKYAERSSIQSDDVKLKICLYKFGFKKELWKI